MAWEEPRSGRPDVLLQFRQCCRSFAPSEQSRVSVVGVSVRSLREGGAAPLLTQVHLFPCVVRKDALFCETTTVIFFSFFFNDSSFLIFLFLEIFSQFPKLWN